VALQDVLAHLEPDKDDPKVGFITKDDLIKAITQLYEELEAQNRETHEELIKLKKILL
jgi:hypothetical protein